MHWKIINIILAAIILVFSFWEMSYSMWIVVIAAAIIIILEVIQMVTKGKSLDPALPALDKTSSAEAAPSKEEVKEVLKKQK